MSALLVSSDPVFNYFFSVPVVFSIPIIGFLAVLTLFRN